MTTTETRRAYTTGLTAQLAKLVQARVWHRVIYAGAATSAVITTLLVLKLLSVLPDGESTQEIADFFAHHASLAKPIMLLMPLIVAWMLLVSGAVTAELYRADTSPGHRLSWIGFASDIAFTTYFAVEVGIFASTNLIAGTVDGQIIHALHVVAFTSAYVLSWLWLPFLVSFLAISIRSTTFPAWINWLAFIAVVTNGCVWFAPLTLAGPLNGQNGIIGLGLPVIGPAVFFIMLTGHLIAEQSAAAILHRTRAAHQTESDPQAIALEPTQTVESESSKRGFAAAHRGNDQGGEHD